MADASTAELFARLALSLAVVLGLMWAISMVLRRRGGLGPSTTPRRRRTRGAELEILARKPLGRNATIAIVRTGDQAMVVGITDHQITKLADADLDLLDLAEPSGETSGEPAPGNTTRGQWTATAQGVTTSGPAWKTMLEQMRERTVRR